MPRFRSEDDPELVLRIAGGILLNLVFTLSCLIYRGEKEKEQRIERWFVEGMWHKPLREAVSY